ncbi:Tripartite-type tricarboxylate transporter, receptor component TctC [Variovorax sp. YR266]|uniref:Bug family tripartite tricarboxylate transporter substrate binding protein n=1 Tax=Variovorax sp. YR266 TaxID=1884386 RepID=UPI000899BDEF|nr:tripartite tricarboxylate transporter substrate binding protein [Variovorax sp. YR266]SDY34393.1 Tripartite-type tricarboxylate transporter, receptor component TctC [Variovorax sp. YR266]
MKLSATRLLCLGFFSMLLMQFACAQDGAAAYPTKPIRLVVTFPPGGAADSMVRLVLPRLSEKLGQPIVVDNRPGAGGNVGLTVVARALADGHTLGLGAAGGLAANVSLYSPMPYDPAKDFKPVGMLAATPFVIVGNPRSGALTLKDVIASAKAKPGTISMGHGGNGTAMHLSTALFRQMADIDLLEIPYRGNGPATVDVLGGQIPLAMVDLPASLQQIKAGKLLAYAVTSAQRLPMLPDVPTVAEAGVPGYESTGWFGLVAPTNTPDAVVVKLNAELNAALADERVKSSMRNLGAEPAPSTPKAFGDYIAAETTKWAKVTKAANIRPE